jgi:hypothetical protein
MKLKGRYFVLRGRSAFVRYAILVLLTGLILVVACGGKDTGWQQIKSKEGGFAIMMPGDPDYLVDTVGTPVGKVAYPSYAVDIEDNYYLVGYSDMPKSLVARAPADIIIEGSCRGVLSEAGGRQVASKLLKKDKYLGREITAEISGGEQVMKIRSYLVGNRLYLIFASAPPSDTIGNFGRFLDSFELIED